VLRFRTIITAAAVPAVSAGLLLAATGASAATVTPAVTTAAVTSSSGPVHAVTYGHLRAPVDDTTGVPTGKTDPTGNGPIWAYDNVKRVVTAVPDKAGNNTWDVTVATEGTYSAFANPITGKVLEGPRSDGGVPAPI